MDNTNNQANIQTSSISKEERDALYRVIFSRRDVRGQFLPDPIPEDMLSRILYAAHYAPSVGFMQPWNFIIVESLDVRKKIHKAFSKAHQEAAEMFEKEKRDIYSSLKLEGILEAPINICVTCDPARSGSVVIGRTHIKTMDSYSSVCAIENLWLAARAEGLGLGWVSIIEESELKEILGIPETIIPIGYLCLGKVSHFMTRPELEDAGWLPRIDIRDLIAFENWNGHPGQKQKKLLQELTEYMDFPLKLQQKNRWAKIWHNGGWAAAKRESQRGCPAFLPFFTPA